MCIQWILNGLCIMVLVTGFILMIQCMVILSSVNKLLKKIQAISDVKWLWILIKKIIQFKFKN